MEKDIHKKYRNRLKLAKRYIKNNVGYFGMGMSLFHAVSEFYNVWRTPDIIRIITSLSVEEKYQLEEFIQQQKILHAIQLLPVSATTYSASGRSKRIKKRLNKKRRLRNRKACYYYLNDYDENKSDINLSEFQHEEYLWELF